MKGGVGGFVLLFLGLLYYGHKEESVSVNEVAVHLILAALALFVTIQLDWHPLIFFALLMLQCVRLIHLVWGLDQTVSR